jgi:uncharacterized membrane protein YsdA (DUF1294 family)
MTPFDIAVLGWLGLTNAVVFTQFAYDKLQAEDRGRGGRRRISEFRLVLWSALGGWPAGLVAMLFFRHKTAKISFQIKFAIAFLVWGALVYAYWRAT